MNYKKLKFKPLTVFVFIWASLVLALLMGFIKIQQKSFDPNNLLFNAALSHTFDEMFANEIKQHLQNTKNLVVHFSSDDACACQLRSSLHVKQIEESVLALHKVNQQWNISHWPIDRRFVPSYPAIAIFDQQGQLTYLGPYSSGLGCNNSNSQIDNYLSVDHRNTPAGIVNTDSIGCYCQRHKSIII